MDSIVIVLIVVLVLAVAGIAAWFIARERRSRRLREHFGPEYERSIESSDDRRGAESELLEREKRHRELDIRPLDDDERKHFADRWAGVQQGFVDDPSRAVGDADALVDDLMRTRGYPLDDFEQRAADISVEHPVVVQRYREARVIADANEAGRADTEDLRQAVTSYRALVVALLEPGEQAEPDEHTEHAEPVEREPAEHTERAEREPAEHTEPAEREPAEHTERSPDAAGRDADPDATQTRREMRA